MAGRARARRSSSSSRASGCASPRSSVTAGAATCARFFSATSISISWRRRARIACEGLRFFARERARTSGRTRSAKRASTAASSSSVFASWPVAFAKSRTCRGFMTATGSRPRRARRRRRSRSGPSPRARRASGRARRCEPRGRRSLGRVGRPARPHRSGDGDVERGLRDVDADEERRAGRERRSHVRVHLLVCRPLLRESNSAEGADGAHAGWFRQLFGLWTRWRACCPSCYPVFRRRSVETPDGDGLSGLGGPGWPSTVNLQAGKVQSPPTDRPLTCSLEVSQRAAAG